MAKKAILSRNDFLEDVFHISGLSQREFADRCCQPQSNISAYFNKGKPLGARALKNCLENYYGWPVIVHREIAPFGGDFSDFPKVPGIFIFYDSAVRVIYFGKAGKLNNLQKEAKQAYNRISSFSVWMGTNLGYQWRKIGDFVKFVSLYEIQNDRIRHNFEVFLLHVFPGQSHNYNKGYFK